MTRGWVERIVLRPYMAASTKTQSTWIDVLSKESMCMLSDAEGWMFLASALSHRRDLFHVFSSTAAVLETK